MVNLSPKTGGGYAFWRKLLQLLGLSMELCALRGT